ncbi:C4-dicarboxylate ABC transporter permease [Alkalihalophilus pseudofirmus]|uniref:TRAP transporter large permease n=1 Tax=Alkalihalobacterium alkalinitrilicum TaxID=427920 RepID=UPI00094C270B|nr:TRAP transporter large permease [Alkalihalobacterium alkalinitrilicum]OLO27286.1 C4-dicarboxylate ABC transporter permease [Alkalihalophilus pseudofirmus]
MIFWLIIPFLISLIIGIPISFSLGVAIVVFMIATAKLPFEVFVQTLYNPTESFPMMAIPFFILAGELMSRSGITDRLINFAKFFMGRFRGGLAHVTVVSGAGFAGLSGSAVAETAALGKTLGPAMKKEGYKKSFTAALIASAGVMAPVIPPSVIMILYGAQMNVSIGAMFMAGIVPGLVIAALLMIVSYVVAVKNNYPTSKMPFTWKGFFDVTLAASLAFVMPIIIVIGIRGGIFTPTEGGAVAAAYAFLVGGLIYRSLTVKDIFDSLIRTGTISAVILLVVAMSAPFGWIMAYFGIPQAFADSILSITESPIIILLLMILLLMFIGMFLEGAAIVMLLGPVLAPVAIAIGMDPVHFAIVMVVAIAIGMATPPVGVNLFVTVPILGTSMEKASKAVLPFIITLFVALLIIAFIPEIVLWLPNMFR